MKKTIILIALVVAFVGLIVFLARPMEFHVEKLEGKTYQIRYESVNVREEPSTDANIVGEKHLNDEVTLTGKKVEYFLCDVNSCWYQTTEGWIIAESILFK